MTQSSSKLYMPRKIGFVIKRHQPEASAMAVEVGQFVVHQNAHVYLPTESAPVARTLNKQLRVKDRKRVHVVTKQGLIDQCDLIVVLGGDGTFLSITRLMNSRSIPVLGVNMGQLGFLTEIKKSEAISTLGAIMAGIPPLISERALLEVTLIRKKKIIYQGPVINDAVISKGAIARIIGLEIGVNGKWAHTVRADGIIVSTPTGSTAYSLAAGGPIVEPSLNALVLSAICPHSLTQRPLVISDQSEIEIRLKDRPGHVLLTLDGQDAIDMKQDDLVIVRRFKKHSLRLISSPTRDYFSLLREKLKFGMRD